MTVQLFLELLFSFSLISGLITEAIKKLVNDKKNLSNNIIALIVALIVGCIGTLIYYQLNGISYTINNIIYMLLLGLASALVSMEGYDKIVQTITQITNKKSVME